MKLKRVLSTAVASTLLTALVATSVPTATITAQADETLTGLTASEIVDQMGLGWNLGNTLDATGGTRDDVLSHETSWGNPVVTKELIQGVKAEGFDTIRIPTTWYNYMDQDYQIDQAYMDRVKEIVTWAYEEDMYIILNVHHEKWVNDSRIADNYEEIGYELAAVWGQIAENFAEFDQHLIFEGMNEPRAQGTSYEWTGNADCYAAVNYLDQVFVNTIRDSKEGYNQERALMIPGYAAGSSSAIMNSISLPTVDGVVCNNLIISVHCYNPYDFCLSDNMKNFDASNSSATGGIDILFSELDELFLSKDIPVVIGETSATAKDNVEARENWARYMGEKSKAYGVPIVLWDNGNDSNKGGESHAHMDRAANKANYPTVFAALMEGYNGVEAKSQRGQAEDAVSPLVDGSVIWSDANGLTSTNSWDITYICLGAQSSYFLEGRDVAIVYSGSSEPKMILDSEVQSQWWMPVDPSRTEDLGDKKVAYFTKSDMDAVLKSFGITDYADLRNMAFIATDDSITSYQVVLTGDAKVVTYKANGADYAIDTQMPADPTFTNMTFEGWYTTKDYQAGTEYTGGALDQDMTVYAKFALDDKALTKPQAEVVEPSEDAGEETSTTKETEVTEGTGTAANAETSASETTDSGNSSKAEKETGKGKLGVVAAVAGVVVVLAGVVAVVLTTKKRKDTAK